MILVDSSVWVDYFQGTITAQTERLDGLLGFEPLAIGDLILTEVLQGFHNERDFNDARTMLTALRVRSGEVPLLAAGWSLSDSRKQKPSW